MKHPVHELVVNEIFGPTVQGEGPACGRVAGFVRLMGCNLTCTWCDTKQTWDGKTHDLRAEAHRMSAADIVKAVLAMNVRLVILTGGEPLLQQHYAAFRDLLRLLHAHGIAVHVETNGTVIPNAVAVDLIDQFVASPKLPNAGMDASRTIKPYALRALNARNAHFKFVCRTAEDVFEVARIAAGNHLPARRVWVMPEGIEAQTVCDHLRQITEAAVLHGFNVSPRLHVLVWGDERGR